MSRKRIHLGKRILAGILTAMMVVSSHHLTMGTVYAEEPTATATEDDSADTESPSHEEDIVNREEPAEEEESADNETEEPSAGEDISDTQEPSDEEDTAADEEAGKDEEDRADEKDGIGESATGELYIAGISDNDLAASEPENTMTEDELEGVYQFGGAPSEASAVSVYSASGQDDEAMEYLYREMLARNTRIDVSAYDIPYDSSGIAIVQSRVSGVLNEHPDLYFVERGYSYWNNGTNITAIAFTYSDAYNDAFFRQNVAAALSRVDSQMSDLEKAVVLHEYLTVNCEYDYENYLNGTIPSESYSAYGTLVNRTAVCQGYALAYKYLLNQMGIDCYMVTSNSMNHAWNMIVLDGQYYQVDVTWDDPVWDKIGRSVHTYMFRSDAAFEGHHDWRVTSGSSVVNYAATDVRYDNAFWTDCSSPLILEGDDCYYVSSERSIHKTVLSGITKKGTAIVGIGTWPVWGGGGTWGGSYSGLFRIGDRLYYNDKSSIYSIALDGTDKKTEFTADTSAGYIYGSAYCQGKVLYSLHQAPIFDAKEEVLTADMDAGSGETVVPVESIELSAYTLELAEGEEAELTATVNPWYATESTVIWTSDDETVAEVSNGIVRAISAGSCTITASAGNKQAQCSVHVTAKEDTALDLDNLVCEYTALDDTKITSVADGRPKLLIFYSNTCYNCRSTIGSISADIADFTGIDIYALETNDGTKEEVAAFQSRYGCEGITFSYDQNDANTQSLFQYARAGGIVGTVSWPLICYIDANNRLQYMTMSITTAEAVLANLQKFCGFSVEKPTVYTITYVLNGGTNNSANPTAYTAEDTVITLFDPVRIGYQFEGWFTDAAYTNRVTAIYGADKRELVLYAKWKSLSEGENSITVKRPDITTYKVGQEISLKGGAVTYLSDGQTKTMGLTADMISGFDSSVPGICTVQVTYGGYMANFDTLIVEEPELSASVGQSLREIALPQNEYGTYTWLDDTAVVENGGADTFDAVFTPKDEIKFQKLTDIRVRIIVQIKLGDDTDVTFKTDAFTYNGAAQEPKVVVWASGTLLTEGQDYTVSYSNNRNAGTATVTINGLGYCLGSTSREFVIKPAQLTITARNVSIRTGDPVPAVYEYEVSGLMADDRLRTEPSFLCEIADTAAPGRYDIRPYGADAGENYIISYGNGELRVASEYVTCAVSFDVQGHGRAPADMIDIKVGTTINRPADPEEAGYRFDGWYRDAACTKAWDFDTDTVQSDMTLYAKWLAVSEDGGFALQEISDVYYTGKACKPAVSVYDGDMLLKQGRDYQIKYYNNINTNKDGVRKQGNGAGRYFNAALPYVEIIGKGNYTDRIKNDNRDTVKVNFNILRTVIGDGSSRAGDGIRLKVSDQFVTAKKVQKPFSSIKYVKGMKKDVDYVVRLTVNNARDQEGRSLQKDSELPDAAVPAGYSGVFLLTVDGIGNYEGSICREIYVTDKEHLLKNATIIIGKNQKNMTYAGSPVRLNPAETATADTFIVKCGRTILKPDRDYAVGYRDNDRVGKAELFIAGMGEYVGSKSAYFNIKGKAFTAKTVFAEGIENKVYTGRAITQNDAVLTYGTGNEPLRYGTDYTISYSRNINKGTATMIFKGAADAGYSGSFKKTFKIGAADIAQTKRPETMQNMVCNYCKAGVKPVEEISLTNREGIILRNGKDYTLKYTNNKAVASASDEKPPTVIVKGRGNYTGAFSLYFTIVRTDLRADSIGIKTTPIAYRENKASDYVYKPAVKLTDGRSVLRVGKDYEIEYRNHTQADYENYIRKLGKQPLAEDSTPQDGEAAEEDGTPVAVITEAAGSAYRLERPIIVPLPIYLNKLTKTALMVNVDEAVYTGSQVTPQIKVSYGGTLLREGEDYTLSYGANVASGKNKGSVVISGISPYYGGSVTVLFDIVKKTITY